MRLANGIVIDKEATFGALKYSALRREVLYAGTAAYALGIRRNQGAYL